MPASPLDWMWGKGMEFGNELAMTGFTNALRMFSPGQLNPLGQNPLAPVLKELLDVEALRDPKAAKLYVGATDVEIGRGKDIYQSGDRGAAFARLGLYSDDVSGGGDQRAALLGWRL